MSNKGQVRKASRELPQQTRNYIAEAKKRGKNNAVRKRKDGAWQGRLPGAVFQAFVITFLPLAMINPLIKVALNYSHGFLALD